MKASRLKTALLGSGAAIALVAASAPASADEISDLRSQIEEMQSRVAQIEAERVEQRRVSSAAAVEAGDRPRTWQLPGTNTSMTVGGYAKLDIIHDFSSTNAARDLFIANLQPVRGSAGAGIQNRTRFHARQSRFWIRTWTPTDWGELATHIEGDFFGAANTGPTNGNGFRLRHAYGRLGPVMAGQTWSTFMPIWSNPEVLDFTGPTGDIFVRQAQIRYTHNFGEGWTLQFALEDPFSGRATVPGTGAAAPAALAGPVGRWPDVILTIHKNYTWLGRGRVGAGFVIRDLYYENGFGASDNAVGWGAYVALGHVFNDRIRMGAQGSIGEGYGKYMIAATGQPDAVLFTNAAGGLEVDPIFGIGGFIWVRFNWTDNIRSTVVFGYHHFELDDELTRANLPGVAGADQHTIHANLIWSPVPQVNIGVEYIYGFSSAFNTPPNLDPGHRLHIAFRYVF